MLRQPEPHGVFLIPHKVPAVSIFAAACADHGALGEIRTAYRKLVLKYHPDRNKDAGEEEKKKFARKFQQIQEAYEKIKLEKESR